MAIIIEGKHLAAACVALALLAGGGFWWVRTTQINDQYAEAAANCRVLPQLGAAQLSVLDRMHGEKARPSDLRIQLSGCALVQAVENYRRASQMAGSK